MWPTSGGTYCGKMHDHDPREPAKVVCSVPAAKADDQMAGLMTPAGWPILHSCLATGAEYDTAHVGEAKLGLRDPLVYLTSDPTTLRRLPNHHQWPGRRAAFKNRFAQRSSIQAAATLDEPLNNGNSVADLSCG
ncbi:hypothetical protein J6590_060973 [Homalodisca vitripennis]|nr:hypothetical protein J6590_060973 [Homalodisca vitripennis]